MARLRNLINKDTDAAVEQIARYYRHSRLYLHESNSTDAYQFYIDSYTRDTELIIEQGHSYAYKGNYLIALDVIQFFKEHPKEAQHYFGIVPAILDACEREVDKSLFICAFGPKKEFLDKHSYACLEAFVKMYKDYVVLTDCPTGYDIEVFHKRTTSDRILIGGREAWRWGIR